MKRGFPRHLQDDPTDKTRKQEFESRLPKRKRSERMKIAPMCRNQGSGSAAMLGMLDQVQRVDQQEEGIFICIAPARKHTKAVENGGRERLVMAMNKVLARVAPVSPLDRAEFMSLLEDVKAAKKLQVASW